jgi:hypothetical protein
MDLVGMIVLAALAPLAALVAVALLSWFVECLVRRPCALTGQAA